MIMNTETPIESFNKRLITEKECYGTDAQVAALNVITNDRRSYQLAYSHFMYSELRANPELERKPDAPPQQMVIHFSMGVVTVLGAALHLIYTAVQKNDLKFIQRSAFGSSLSDRHSSSPVVVTSVAIALSEGKP